MNTAYGVGEWIDVVGITASDVDTCKMKVVDDTTLDIAYLCNGCDVNYLRITGITDVIACGNESDEIQLANDKFGYSWVLILNTPNGRIYIDCDLTLTAEFSGPDVMESDTYSTSDLDDAPEEILEALEIVEDF